MYVLILTSISLDIMKMRDMKSVKYLIWREFTTLVTSPWQKYQKQYQLTIEESCE